MIGEDLPDLAAIRTAHGRIAGHALRTPVLRHPTLDEFVGAEVHLKCETMQRGGSFKFRGALNAVLGLTHDEAAKGVAAHSSGNHATALALAAAIRGVPAYLVMPTNAPRAKRGAVLAAGAQIIDCGASLLHREQGLAVVLSETGAHEVHPNNDPRVIAGAGTAAVELLEEVPDVELVIAPVGGGGLLSGTAIAIAGLEPRCQSWGAEPSGADDAYRSFTAGRRLSLGAPDTIADGLRTELNERTFGAILEHVQGIVTVTDNEIVEAMRLMFTGAKLVVEASAAVAVAGAQQLPRPLPRRIGIILSGGNLDLGKLPFTAEAEASDGPAQHDPA